MTTLLAWFWFYPHPGRVVAALDKTLCDDYLCLVVSNKQQISVDNNSKKSIRNIRSLETPNPVADSFKHEIVIVMKKWLSFNLTLSGDRTINKHKNNIAVKNENFDFIATLTKVLRLREGASNSENCVLY